MIKYIFSILAILFIFKSELKAQKWNFAIRLNGNYCNPIVKETPPNPFSQFLFYADPRVGGGISFVAQKKYFERIMLDAELGYSLQGGILKFGDMISLGNTHYVQFSPSLLLKPIKKIDLHVSMGLRLAYLAGTNMRSENKLEKFDFSWPIGLEYRRKNLAIYLRYIQSFNPFYVLDLSTQPSYQYYNRLTQLGVTYYLFKNKQINR